MAEQGAPSERSADNAEPRGTTRSDFLGAGAAALGATALASLWRGQPASAGQSAGDTASRAVSQFAFDPLFEGSRFFFEVDDRAAWVIKVEGGNPASPVVAENLGIDGVIHKHIGAPKYGEVSLRAAIGFNSPVFAWVKDSFDRAPTHKTGEVVACDFDNRIRHTRGFSQALISEIGFPACDGGVKDGKSMGIKFESEVIDFVARTGQAPLGKAGLKPVPLDFKVEIEGIATRRVSRIEAFTVKQPLIEDDFGTVNAGRLEFPNLQVKWEGPDFDAAKSWLQWFDDFVIKGNNGEGNERSGAIRYFNPKEIEVARVGLVGIGIFKLTGAKVQSGDETVRRLTADLYCEDMTFDYRGSPTWAS